MTKIEFRKLIFSLLAIGLFFQIALSCEQDKITISPKKKADIEIQGYRATWSQEVIEPNGTERIGINTITDTVSVEKTIRGERIIHRIVRWTDTAGNFFVKTERLDYTTLLPISIDVRWNPSYIQHTDLVGTTLLSSSIQDEFSTARLTVSTLKDIGYSWSSDGFTLVAVGKITAKEFSLQTLQNLPHEPEIGKTDFESLGKEIVEINGIGVYSTKLFSTVNSQRIVATYWLANVKPYVVKVSFRKPDGQKTTWKLESVE